MSQQPNITVTLFVHSLERNVATLKTTFEQLGVMTPNNHYNAHTVCISNSLALPSLALQVDAAIIAYAASPLCCEETQVFSLSGELPTEQVWNIMIRPFMESPALPFWLGIGPKTGKKDRYSPEHCL